jgi:RHS repeat-associated protein
MHLTNFHFYNPKNNLYSKPVKGLQGYGVGYGFAFNGKEKDDEINVKEGVYDFGARICDVRLGGRFFSVDPRSRNYADLSPYAYAANNPIYFIDKNGENPAPVIYLAYEGITYVVAIVSAYYVAQAIKENMPSYLSTLPIYLSYNHAYDWQRRQEQAGKAYNNARDIAIKNMIDRNFNQNNEDPKNWKIPPKGAIILVATLLYKEIKDQLAEMQNDLSKKSSNLQERITILKRKGSLTESEMQKLAKLEKQNYQVNVDLQGVRDAIERTNEQIANEQKKEKEQKQNGNGSTPQDNTSVAGQNRDNIPEIKKQ